jgi:hypothetical protein
VPTAEAQVAAIQGDRASAAGTAKPTARRSNEGECATSCPPPRSPLLPGPAAGPSHLVWPGPLAWCRQLGDLLLVTGRCGYLSKPFQTAPVDTLISALPSSVAAPEDVALATFSSVNGLNSSTL